MTLDLPIPARHDASANVEVTTMPLYKRGDVWWHTFRGWDGQRRRKSTGTRDKRTATIIASERENRHALAADGIIDPADIERAEIARSVRVSEVIDEWDATDDQVSIVRSFVEYAGITRASDFGSLAVCEKVRRFLEIVEKRGVQIRRVNDHLRAVRRFGEALYERGMIRVNEINRVPLRNQAVDRKRIEHRSFTIAEADALSGRRTWYAFLIWTGIRAEEAKRLRRRDFNLGDQPTLTVRKEIAKNGFGVTVPLASVLADVMRSSMSVAMFPDIPTTRWGRRDLLASDLAALGITGSVNQRSFRMTFTTWARRSGMSTLDIQRFRRDKGRGSQRLQQVNYTDGEAVMPELRSAIESMVRWVDAHRAREAAS